MKNRSGNDRWELFSRLLPAVLITTAMLFVPVMPVQAQLVRSLGKLENVFNRSAKTVSREVRAGSLARETALKTLVRETSVASRLAQVSTRLTAPALNRGLSRNLVRSTMTDVGSALRTVRSKHAGSLSVSIGALGRKRTARAINESILKKASISTGTTVSVSKISSGQITRETEQLRRIAPETLSLQDRQKLGNAIRNGELNAATAKTRSLQLSFLEQSKKSAPYQPQKLPFHKNSNAYFGPTHVYVIVDPQGRLFKVGESAAGVANGRSLRAESQVRKLNRNLSDPQQMYRSRIIKNVITKQEARDLERQLIMAYRKKHGPGGLPGNLNNR